MTSPESRDTSSQTQINKRMGLVPIWAGCLTFLMAGVALVIGLLIDLRLGTSPRWMVIILLGSLPITLGLVFLLVRLAVKTSRVAEESEEKPLGD